MIIGDKGFDFKHHFYIMGILNVTPDSFSDGGKYNDLDKALMHAERLISDGADIIDIGGESTRPGYTKISPQEEISRICPIIEAVKKHFNVPVSLDTYKSEVAESGILAGADLINDIWGLKGDDMMVKVIAKHDVPCCLMHNRNNNNYRNLMKDILSDLQNSIDVALEGGICKENIILDPGIGFAKDLKQNLQVMNNLDMLHSLEFPILLGTSRKSMIGFTLDLPVNQREEGTIATSVMGLMAGCSVFRVHDVKANLRALRMAEAVLES